MKHPKRYLPILLLLIIAILAWFVGIGDYLNLDALKAHQHIMQDFVMQHGILSAAMFAGAYTLIVSLSLPLATFMTLTGGFLFGQWVGTGLVVVSATAGASILFLSAKLASKDLLTQKAGSFVLKMQRGFQENAMSYLLTLRLIPLFPFAAINLVAAILQIPFRVFFFGTLFGIIPGSFVYVSLGVALREVISQPDFSAHLILNPKILVALTGLGVLALLPVIYRRWKSLHAQ